jgi:hypothetical protein
MLSKTMCFRAVCIWMPNVPISGRGRHHEFMRAVRFALRCIGLLDIASASTPPRPICRAFYLGRQSYAMRLSAATGCEEATAHQRGGVRTLKVTRTPMSNAAFSGRGRRHSMLLRTAVPALRCNALLDSASFRAPPRPTRRAFNSVADSTHIV